MAAKRRRARSGTYEKRGGYSTDKQVSVSKLPKGPGPGAVQKAPKRPKKK